MSFKDLQAGNMAFILSHCGNVVSYNGITGNGLLFYDPTEALQLGNKAFAISDNELTLTIATGSFGTLKNNTAIVVDSKNYLIKKFILLSDGLEEKLWLSGNN